MTVFMPPEPPPTMEPCVLCGEPAEIKVRVEQGGPPRLVSGRVKTQRCSNVDCEAFNSWRVAVA